MLVYGRVYHLYSIGGCKLVKPTNTYKDHFFGATLYDSLVCHVVTGSTGLNIFNPSQIFSTEIIPGCSDGFPCYHQGSSVLEKKMVWISQPRGKEEKQINQRNILMKNHEPVICCLTFHPLWFLFWLVKLYRSWLLNAQLLCSMHIQYQCYFWMVNYPFMVACLCQYWS